MHRFAVAVTAFAAALGVAALAADARAETSGGAAHEAARFSYVGYMGGLKIGWAEADVAFAEGRYAATLKMETGGMVGWFVEWRHGSEAYGGTAAAGDAPLSADRYRNDSFSKGRDRLIEVAYPGHTAEVTFADPHPVRDEGRPAVDPALLTNVLDPLSAIVAIGRRIETSGKCDASFGVFDGRRRYQLKVVDEGRRDLGRSRYAPYGGPARRCGFVFERIAGFKNMNNDEPTSGHAYFRRAADGAPLMPVQIVADTQYGAAILHLQGLELLDATLVQQAARKTDGPTPE